MAGLRLGDHDRSPRPAARSEAWPRLDNAPQASVARRGRRRRSLRSVRGGLIPALEPLRRAQARRSRRSPCRPRKRSGRENAGRAPRTPSAPSSTRLGGGGARPSRAAASPRAAPRRTAKEEGRRARGNGNPELMTLVTAAMDPKPVTPGGRGAHARRSLRDRRPGPPSRTVARRITRLKLFPRPPPRCGASKSKKGARTPDEGPRSKDPNAMLRPPRARRTARRCGRSSISGAARSASWRRQGTRRCRFSPSRAVWELARARGPDGLAGNRRRRERSVRARAQVGQPPYAIRGPRGPHRRREVGHGRWARTPR